MYLAKTCYRRGVSVPFTFAENSDKLGLLTTHPSHPGRLKTTPPLIRISTRRDTLVWSLSCVTPMGPRIDGWMPAHVIA